MRALGRWFFLAAFAVLLCTTVPPLSAQGGSGKVIGRVTDAQGAVIPGAAITVTNADTHIVWHTTSGADGAYQVLNLPIGRYSVSVSHPGFARVDVSPQVLSISQSLRVPIRMQVGSVTQNVTVAANAVQVETQNPTVGGTVTGATIQNLPLNGRNTLSLALTQPGVVPSPGEGPGGASFSVAGGRTNSVVYLLNGGINNATTSNSVVFNPNPDTVSEFRILTNNYEAQYGKNAGGVVIEQTKSGTNAFHGSAFEYLRNTSLNANDFFNNEGGRPRQVLRRSQFGGTFGGRVIKNKLFFFVGYQGQKQTATINEPAVTVYTPAELKGDFSQASTCPATAPATGNVPCPDSGVVGFLQSHPYYQPDPALQAQGIIAPGSIDPVAQKYIAAGLVPSDPSGVFFPQGNGIDNVHQYFGRADYYMSASQQLSVTLGRNTEPSINPINGSDPNVPGYPAKVVTTNEMLNIGWTSIVSPATLNVFRATAQRYDNALSPDATLPGPNALGVNINSDDPNGPPKLSFASGMTTGFNENDTRTKTDNTFAYTDDLTLTRGTHTIMTGIRFAPVQEISTYAYNVTGWFFFDGPSSSGGIGSQNDLADFLLGLPDTYLQTPKAQNDEHQKQWAAFLQDQWRATPNLTLTYGLRYEYYSPEQDHEGKSFSIIPGVQSKRFVNAPPGLVVPGDPGAPKGWYFPDYTNLAPRFGFAWDLSGNGTTSIRGGAGMFFDSLNGWMSDWDNGVLPWWPAVALYYSTPANGPANIMSDPYGAASTPDPFPSTPPPADYDFAAAGDFPYSGGDIPYGQYVNPHMRTPYVYQYNLSLQHQLASGLMFEIGYLGNSSHKLMTWSDENPVIPSTITTTTDPGSGDVTRVGERYLNIAENLTVCPENLDGTPCSTPSYGPLLYFDGLVHANYNALEASLTQRNHNMAGLGNFFYTLAYTWSHNLDNGDGFNSGGGDAFVPFLKRNQFYGNSNLDMRHRFVLSGGWTLPFDHWWTGSPRELTGGWTLYPILTLESGQPMDFYVSSEGTATALDPGASGYGDPGLVRPDVVGSTAPLNPRQNQTLTTSRGKSVTGNFWFNPASLAANSCIGPQTCPVGFYGTMQRNSIIGPGLANLDLALEKTLTLFSESKTLAFRAEAFNVLNHTEFQAPSTSRVSSSTLGRVSQTYGPRIIQLSLRFAF